MTVGEKNPALLPMNMTSYHAKPRRRREAGHLLGLLFGSFIVESSCCLNTTPDPVAAFYSVHITHAETLKLKILDRPFPLHVFTVWTSTLPIVGVRDQGLEKQAHHEFDLRGSFRLSVLPP